MDKLTAFVGNYVEELTGKVVSLLAIPEFNVTVQKVATLTFGTSRHHFCESNLLDDG